MKKQILILATILPIMFFFGIKKGNIKKIESVSIVAKEERLTPNAPLLYRTPVSDDSQAFSSSFDNSWEPIVFDD